MNTTSKDISIIKKEDSFSDVSNASSEVSSPDSSIVKKEVSSSIIEDYSPEIVYLRYLENQLNDKKKNITALKQENCVLKENYATLESRVRELERKNQDLKNEAVLLRKIMNKENVMIVLQQ